MVLQWVYSGETVALAGDYRSCSWQPSSEFADATAGSDPSRIRLQTIKDATASLTLVAQSGGTALAAALDAGVAGTLIISPEGTATGKRKITFPCFSQGGQFDYPYSDVVTVSCSFTGNGAYTDSAY